MRNSWTGASYGGLYQGVYVKAAGAVTLTNMDVRHLRITLQIVGDSYAIEAGLGIVH